MAHTFLALKPAALTQLSAQTREFLSHADVQKQLREDVAQVIPGLLAQGFTPESDVQVEEFNVDSETSVLAVHQALCDSSKDVRLNVRAQLVWKWKDSLAPAVTHTSPMLIPLLRRSVTVHHSDPKFPAALATFNYGSLPQGRAYPFDELDFTQMWLIFFGFYTPELTELAHSRLDAFGEQVCYALEP